MNQMMISRMSSIMASSSRSSAGTALRLSSMTRARTPRPFFPSLTNHNYNTNCNLLTLSPLSRDMGVSWSTGNGWSLQRSCTYVSTSTIASQPNARSATKRMPLPPNLKIDPRSTSSQYIVSRVLDDDNDTSEDDDVDDDKNDSDDGTVDDSPSESEDEDDDDDDQLWFQLPTPRYVIPLPERLYIDIIDKTNLMTAVGSIHLSATVFGQDQIRTDLIQRVVQYQRNKKRGYRNAGAKTKTISEVSGSGKKVRKQKGGGTSRAGHKRPAHWRGGAKAHGPKGKVQNYTTKLNKKTRKLGMVHALSQKLKEGNLMVVNDLMIETHKTRKLATVLENVGLSGRKGTSAYLVDWANNDDPQVVQNLPVHLAVAAGNLPRIKVSTQAYINVYDIIKHEKLILTLAAVEALEKRFANVTY